MTIIVIQAFGVLVFLAGSLWLVVRIRAPGTGKAAEKASRFSHTLFWLGLVLPGMIGFFYPGYPAYDELLGVPGLPAPFLWKVIGIVLLLAGSILMGTSNRFLIQKGRGAAAFLLTKDLVTGGIYGRTRNPMSLGFYAACLGVGMISGSLTVSLGVLLVIMPVHVFNLRCFEEQELERRYGNDYIDYKRRVPFLIPRMTRR